MSQAGGGRVHFSLSLSLSLCQQLAKLPLQTSLGQDLAPMLYFYTQLSTKFELLTKMKMSLALSLSDVVFIVLINVKMPTYFGILSFMSRINFVLS